MVVEVQRLTSRLQPHLLLTKPHLCCSVTCPPTNVNIFNCVKSKLKKKSNTTNKPKYLYFKSVTLCCDLKHSDKPMFLNCLLGNIRQTEMQLEKEILKNEKTPTGTLFLGRTAPHAGIIVDQRRTYSTWAACRTQQPSYR